MKFLKNQSGFSLVEVLVAMVISAVVSMGVLQINKNMMQSQQRFKQSASVADFKFLSGMYLMNTDNCTAVLSPITDITDSSQFPTTIGNWEVGQEVSPKVKLTNIELEELDTSSNILPIVFTVQKENNSSSGGTQIKIRHNVPVVVYTDPSTSLVSVTRCKRMDENSVLELACNATGSKWDASLKKCDGLNPGGPGGGGSPGGGSKFYDVDINNAIYRNGKFIGVFDLGGVTFNGGTYNDATFSGDINLGRDVVGNYQMKDNAIGTNEIRNNSVTKAKLSGLVSKSFIKRLYFSTVCDPDSADVNYGTIVRDVTTRCGLVDGEKCPDGFSWYGSGGLCAAGKHLHFCEKREKLCGEKVRYDVFPD
jgi:prepilin-type N-terminal cleavage/methylation domain-containing protein